MKKSIDTDYDGYKFRSRLEARWAVFWNVMHEPYDYEVEGWDLQGLRYLPDFWLPKRNSWIEIKPEAPTGADMNKIGALAAHSDASVYMIAGTTWPGKFEIFEFVAEPSKGTEAYTIRRGNTFCACPTCGYLMMVDPSYPAHNARENGYCHECNVYGDRLHPQLMAAYRAARQARFEHGDKPQAVSSPRQHRPTPSVRAGELQRVVGLPQQQPMIIERKTEPGGPPQVVVPVRRPRFSAGMSVRHPMFGVGIVVSSELNGIREEVMLSLPGRGIKRFTAELAHLEIVDQRAENQHEKWTVPPQDIPVTEKRSEPIPSPSPKPSVTEHQSAFAVQPSRVTPQDQHRYWLGMRVMHHKLGVGIVAASEIKGYFEEVTVVFGGRRTERVVAKPGHLLILEQPPRKHRFFVGMKVRHPEMGVGEIVEADLGQFHEQVRVYFEGRGTKTYVTELTKLEILDQPDQTQGPSPNLQVSHADNTQRVGSSRKIRRWLSVIFTKSSR